MESLVLTSLVIYIITLSLFSYYSILGRHGYESPIVPDYLLYILLVEAIIIGFFFTYGDWLNGELPVNFRGWLGWILGAILAGGILMTLMYYISFFAFYIGLIVPFMICVFLLNKLFGIDVSFDKTDSYYMHFDLRIAIIAGINIASFIALIVTLVVK